MIHGVERRRLLKTRQRDDGGTAPFFVCVAKSTIRCDEPHSFA